MLDRTAFLRSSHSVGDAVLSSADALAARWHDTALLAARVAIAVIFILSGYSHLMGLDRFAADLLAAGVPFARAVAPVAGVVEFLGGLAILFGFATRYAALLMSLFTLIAALTSHRFWSAPPDAAAGQQIHFLKNIAIIGGYIALFVSGPGRYSIDRLGRHGE